MKNILLSIILVFPLYTFAQLDFGVQAAMNAPIDYTNGEIARKMGGELQFQLCKTMNNTFAFETGFLVDAYGRIDQSEIDSHEEASFMRFSAYIPLLMKQSVFGNKLTIKYGIMLSGRNLLTFTKYSGMNPEDEFIHGFENDINLYPPVKAYGIDFSIGAQYNLSEEIGVICNYHSPFDISNNQYGLLSLGMNYTFGKKK